MVNPQSKVERDGNKVGKFKVNLNIDIIVWYLIPPKNDDQP